jgi:precorrin-4/cobalt-precorrin-4 C11-methyltransferase
MNTDKGRFYLVSVGIGDADNITIKAQKIIEQADIVFAMDFIRDNFAVLLADKEIHDAGHGFFTKEKMNSARGDDEDRQRKIIRDAVANGKTVAVLDFGDPTLFSPQSGYLREFADLDPKVIPGISSFNAANAAIGMELTGKYDRAVVLTDAMPGRDGVRERLTQLAATHSTLVFFTMRMDLANTVALLKSRYPGETPAVIVSHAGFAEKETVLRATLDTIVESAQGIAWEHLLYVGPALSREV